MQYLEIWQTLLANFFGGIVGNVPESVRIVIIMKFLRRGAQLNFAGWSALKKIDVTLFRKQFKGMPFQVNIKMFTALLRYTLRSSMPNRCM